MNKPNVNRCPKGGHHRWKRSEETRASSRLSCVRCGESFVVEKNPTRFADMEKSK